MVRSDALTGQHIVLISRRFAPAIGGAESVMANLAFEFAKSGFRTTVLTSRFDRNLSREEERDGYRIVRLPTSHVRYVGTSIYLFALRRWLRSHSKSIDGVVVSMLKHCASTAIDALRDTTIPVVVRGEGTGLTGDCAWHATGRFGMRIRNTCRNADALIAFTPTLVNELLAAGYSSSQIRQIPNGVRTSHCTQPDQQAEARASLPQLMPGFSARRTDLVAIYTGRLHAGKGLLDLVRAWPLVLSKLPAAQCWLVGDGPQYDELRREIAALKLESAVFLVEPNVVNRPIELLLRAADIFILPSYEEGMSMSLLEALACGTACCVSDIAGNRSLIEPEKNGLLFPARDSRRLADAVIRLLSDVTLRNQLASAGFHLVDEQFSATRMCAEHWKVIETIRREKQDRSGL